MVDVITVTVCPPDDTRLVKLDLWPDRDFRIVHEMLMPWTYWTGMTRDDKLWGYCIHQTGEPLKGMRWHKE